VLSRQDAAPLAYIGGSLGTLIGADLLNLDKLQTLGRHVDAIMRLARDQAPHGSPRRHRKTDAGVPERRH
jgi:hypothetical protein